MSAATFSEGALAQSLRQIACAAHNATRERDRLDPKEFPGWYDIPVDQRAGWIAVASHVLRDYAPKNLDPEALVQAAGSAIYLRMPMVIGPIEAQELARLALETAGVISKREECAK